ncbi:MAG TPA: ATP-binding protein [Actinomycetes bacterium]|nr:ATP-binding protein [Actinomycetes bacterium]
MRRLRVQLTVLLALLGLLVAAWGATIFLGAHEAAHRNASLQSEVDRFDQLRRVSSKLGAGVVEVEAAQQRYLLTADPAARAQWLDADERSSRLMVQVEQLAAPWPGLRVDLIGVAYRSWLRAGQWEAGKLDQGGPAAASTAVRTGVAGRRFELLRTRQMRLEQSLADLQTGTARRQGQTYRAAQTLALRSACMVLAAVALISVYLRRTVGGPADALRSASSRLAGGNLETPIELAADNELGAVASDLEIMRRRLAGRMEALERLRSLSAQVVGATSLQQLCEVALLGLQPEVGATRAAIGSVRPAGLLRLRALAGFPDEGVADDIVKAGDDIRGLLPLEALRRGQVVGVVDIDEVPKPASVRELAARMGVRAVALVPLVSRGSFVGLLGLFWTERHRLDREQEALLGLAGNQIAGAVATALRLEEAEQAAGEARAVFYAIADGVLLTDPFGRVTAMNRALEALSGWTEPEARGRPYDEVLPVTDEHGGPALPAGRPPRGALPGAAPAAGQGVGVDLLTRWGRRVPVAISSAPILDHAGRVIGGVDVVRDVSREREVDEVKSALISTVSHELRTPLTLIHGFAELLALREMPQERRRSAAEEILEASRRLARLIDDLLSVSRMDSGRLVLDPRPLDLAGLVERTLSPFRAMATRHALRTKLPSNLPVIWGDPDKVEQILTNLVGNAIKYSPAGGEVLVTVERDGDGVRVSVRDQGIGMSPRDMTQLFQKFHRVDRDEVRRAGGTGLGLYITKRLVEMHGGGIWVESWPQAGSVFTFTLPAEGGEGA